MVARRVTLLLSICVVAGAHLAQAQTNPVLKTKVEPVYTDGAAAAGIQGEVWIEAVIGVDGKLTSAKVVKSLDKVFGLDEQAMFAAAQWIFEPATTNGQAVAKTVTLILEFKPKAPVLRFVGGTSQAPPEFGAGAQRPGPGVTNPRLITKIEPKYTTAAHDAGIKGEVWLEAVVLADGTVGDLRVVKSLDARLGLDAAAVDAARKWLFRPATVNGAAVPILVTLILEFR